MHEIREVVPDDGNAIVKSVITVANDNGSFDVYTTRDVFHCIHLIQKNADSKDIYYPTKEEAQAACHQYNCQNDVYEKLEEYRKIKLVEDLAYWEFKESLMEAEEN